MGLSSPLDYLYIEVSNLVNTNQQYNGLIPCKPRVLIVEDKLNTREDYAENLRRWGYEPILAEGQGRSLIANAQSKARLQRCHVAIVDMRLLDNDHGRDNSGIELIPKLLPTVSIVVSAYIDVQQTRDALLNKGAVDVLVKGGKKDRDQLRAALNKAIHDTCACGGNAKVIWPAGLSSAITMRLLSGGDAAVPNDQANEALCRLFPNARDLRLETLGGATRTPSLAPRLRSIVLKVFEDDREPVVVKLARPERIHEETTRFKEYIDGQLIAQPYAKLERTVVLWDIGGAVYNFLGSSLRSMRSFSSHFNGVACPDITASMDQFFSETWSKHYRYRREAQGTSLFLAYTSVWGTEWHDRLREFVNQSAYIRFSYPLDHLRLPNPVAWVIKRVDLANNFAEDASDLPGTETAITHGDLLGDNIFIDSGRIFALDYERTGRGPILQDFVELETDILTRLAAFPVEELPIFYKLILVLVTSAELGRQHHLASLDHQEANRVLCIISGLRSVAQRQTGIPDMRQYLWGVLLNTVFRATLLPDKDEFAFQRERTLLLGSIISHRLDHWDMPWPNEELLLPIQSLQAVARYNIEMIKRLLKDAFSIEELVSLTYDYYLEVYDNFTTDMNATRRRQELVAYCERHMRLDELLNHIARLNPTQYARYAERLRL